jgi:carboxyl-terminal processing protease
MKALTCKKHRLAVAVFTALCLAILFVLPASAQQAPPPGGPTQQPAKSDGQKRQESFEIVWNTINQIFYDPAFGGVDWQQAHERYAPLVAKADSDAQFHLLLQEMLNELHQSHFVVIPREAIPELPLADGADDSEAADEPDNKDGGNDLPMRRLHRVRRALGERLTNGIGIDLRVIDGKAVVTRVEAGSTAAVGGLRPGFVIRTVNGKPLSTAITEIENHPIWHALIRAEVPLFLVATYINGAKQVPVQLDYVDGFNRAHSIRLKREELKGEMAPAIGNLPAMYTEFESKRMAGGFGYIRFNAFVPAIMQKLCPAIRSMRDAPGLILDLRGNRGGLIGMTVGLTGLLESHPTTIGVMEGRTGRIPFVGFPQQAPYTGPLVILVDGSTESAGEMFASAMQEDGRAMVIGQTTAGNALPSGIIELPTGALFQYGLGNFRTPHGGLLEGRGVIPDVNVPLNRRSLLHGVDPQLATALRQLRPARRPRIGSSELIADMTVAEPRTIVTVNEPGDSKKKPPATPDTKALGDPKTEPPPPPPPKPVPPPAGSDSRPGDASDLPAIEDILQKYRDAIGGRQAFEKLTSRVSKGTVELGALKVQGVAEFYEKSPNKSVAILDIPKLGVLVRGFDGRNGWLQDPLQGYIELSGYALGQARLDSDFQRQINLKSLYRGLSVKGKVKIGDRDAYLVQAVNAAFGVERLYFDVQSGLLLRKGETYFEDYRAVDGVMLPFKIREEPFSGLGTTYTLTEIKHNLEIENSKFAPYPSCFTQPGK